jgi:hypothetical protein
MVGTLQNTSRYHASTFSSQEINTVLQILQWPTPLVFPALDLAR